MTQIRKSFSRDDLTLWPSIFFKIKHLKNNYFLLYKNKCKSKKLKNKTTFNEKEIDNPANPGEMFPLPIMTNSDANSVTKLPISSTRTPIHLLGSKQLILN